MFVCAIAHVGYAGISAQAIRHSVCSRYRNRIDQSCPRQWEKSQKRWRYGIASARTPNEATGKSLDMPEDMSGGKVRVHPKDELRTSDPPDQILVSVHLNRLK